jgi:quinol monooxygenase YgiN
VQRLLIAEIHGLGGRDGELARVLADLAAGGRTEDGCLLFRALRGDEAGEFVVLASWRDEAALRAHYRGATYQRYRAAVGELLARPSDVTIHAVDQSYRPAGDMSLDPTRQD